MPPPTWEPAPPSQVPPSRAALDQNPLVLPESCLLTCMHPVCAGGQARFDFFKQVVAAPSLNLIGLAWDWTAFDTGKLWVVLFTLL